MRQKARGTGGLWWLLGLAVSAAPLWGAIAHAAGGEGASESPSAWRRAQDAREASLEKRLREQYRPYVGYEQLREELGEDIPNGAGIRVMQVEVSNPKSPTDTGWAPDPTVEWLKGKRFLLPGFPSKHATDVAFMFYGPGAIAHGVTEIECYPNSVWAFDPMGFLRTHTESLPQVALSRVANHSWVGRRGLPDGDERGAQAQGTYLEVLKRIDYLVATDDFIQVGGANNTSDVPDVLQGSYNGIVVGKPNARHSSGTNDLGEETYCSGRAKPDIIAPQSATSLASPIIAGSAVVLVGYAHGKGKALSHGSYVSPRTGTTLYHAETSEVIKAALMAGADRETHDRQTLLGNLSRYRYRREHRTANGLDTRYGAGRVNLRNSYHILTAGECDSAEDSGRGGDGREGQIKLTGFDYDPAFGGAEGSNKEASYTFTAPHGEPRLCVTLAWNVAVNESADRWDGKVRLHDMDLKLFDLTRTHLRPVARSASWVDNTESIYCPLSPRHTYKLSVTVPENQGDFCWDYALAWRVWPP